MNASGRGARIRKAETIGVAVVPWLFVGLVVGACSATAPPEEPAPAGDQPEAVEEGAGMVQPGAPGDASRRVDPANQASRPHLPHTEADVLFMQNMIHHHAQALEMSRLVPDRTENRTIHLLAQRIHRSQTDEIHFMQRWLEARGEEAPDPPALHEGEEAAEGGHAAHHGGGDTPLMAGILTPEQLQELADARHAEFDQKFLEFMMFHHAGALEMVAELFASPGAAQDSEIYQFASHVDADQRMEIGRMQQLLREMADDR